VSTWRLPGNDGRLVWLEHKQRSVVCKMSVGAKICKPGYPKSNRKPQKTFKHMDNLISFAYAKDNYGCHIEKRLKGIRVVTRSLFQGHLSCLGKRHRWLGLECM
jgi:hypothetical protein